MVSRTLLEAVKVFVEQSIQSGVFSEKCRVSMFFKFVPHEGEFVNIFRTFCFTIRVWQLMQMFPYYPRESGESERES